MESGDPYFLLKGNSDLGTRSFLLFQLNCINIDSVWMLSMVCSNSRLAKHTHKKKDKIINLYPDK